MRILFVNPPSTTSLHVTEKGKYVEENIGNQFFIFPRIPFEVMAMLNDIKGVDKDIILLDFEWYKNPELAKEELVDLVVEKNPDIILTTIIAQANADSIDWLTTQIKQKLPKIPIIIGGQAVRHFKEKIFKFCPNIDFALINGNNLVNLIKCLKDKSKIKNIKGLICREDKKNEFSEISNPNNFNPESLYSSYKDYISKIIMFVKNRNVYPLGILEFSKGCLFNCDFCAGKSKYMEKDISTVIKEIKYLYKLGIHKFYISDLTFGINRKFRDLVLDNLKEFKKKNDKFGFRCITRADLITNEFVQQLLESGCYEVGIGVECNERKILNLMNKKTSKDKNTKALEILGGSGISFKLFLIEGYSGSNTSTSKRTFEMLNSLEDKNYNYFIQPALNRDIIPTQKRFKEKEEIGIIKRGTINQLDFRHDCRKYGWDTDKSIRSICLLMLAYPSTELGKRNKDLLLQDRILLDIPFLKDGVNITDVISFIKHLNPDKGEILSLRKDVVNFIDGVYTINEIKKRIKKLYPNLNVDKEVDFCLDKLKKEGLIDSFGNPNKRYPDCSLTNNIKFKRPRRKEDIFLFWNGCDQRYIYAPLNENVIKIKTHFYKNISEEVFEFLILSKGIFSIDEISGRLYKLFKRKIDFKNREESKKTTNNIHLTCKKYGLCN